MAEVSVIMGVYNCRNIELLKESVNSIIEQTYSDWELIICNDGSTNNTLNELLQIAKIDSRIKILTYSENKGLAYALNYCIKNSKGKYIARQDDDDISYPSRLAEQIEFLKNHPEFDFVGCIADVYDASGIWGEYNLDEVPNKEAFLWTNPFAHPTVVIRR